MCPSLLPVVIGAGAVAIAMIISLLAPYLYRRRKSRVCQEKKE